VVKPQVLQHHHLQCSPGLLEWLTDESISLAVVAGGRLVVVSADRAIGDSAEIALDGIAATTWDGDSLWAFDRWQLWRFVDALAGVPDFSTRRMLLAQSAHTIGLVGASDLAVTTAGPVLASSLFSCLAVPDDRLAFRPVWAPPWVTALRPEWRTGLSGMAVRSGLVDAVTVASKSDEPGGEGALTGGGLVLTTDGEEMVGGLTWPRQPRWWHDTLLVAEGGSGHLLAVQPERQEMETVTEVPGVAGGLAVHGSHAVIGFSAASRSGVDGLAGGHIPAAATPRDGISLVDLERGTVIGEGWFAGHAGPLTSIAVIPDASSACIVEPRNVVSHSTIMVEHAEPLRPSQWSPMPSRTVGESRVE
jgi:uncharacterized protein (TIGR03032 family)